MLKGQAQRIRKSNSFYSNMLAHHFGIIWFDSVHTPWFGTSVHTPMIWFRNMCSILHDLEPSKYFEFSDSLVWYGYDFWIFDQCSYPYDFSFVSKETGGENIVQCSYINCSKNVVFGFCRIARDFLFWILDFYFL